jgi:pyridine nucleotide-disulfide oxidoreductase
MKSSEPMWRAFGRWAIVMSGAHSLIRPTTTSRLWRQIFWMAIDGAGATAIPAYALYTDPPLGRAGMTELEVRRTGRGALVGKIAMEDVSRAFEKGETDGFMKVLVDADSKNFWMLRSWAQAATKPSIACSTPCMPKCPTPSCNAPCISMQRSPSSFRRSSVISRHSQNSTLG